MGTNFLIIIKCFETMEYSCYKGHKRTNPNFKSRLYLRRSTSVFASLLQADLTLGGRDGRELVMYSKWKFTLFPFKLMPTCGTVRTLRSERVS